jgi:hypothetical protein
MQNWQGWLSIAAMVVSVASWWHNWSAHRERRFGEIAKTRTEFLQRLTLLEERLADLRTGFIDAKYGLRSLLDSGEKYKAIESAAGQSKDRDDCEARAYLLRRTIEARPASDNSSDMLRSLQISEQELVSLEHGADRLTGVAEAWIEMFKDNNDRKARLAAARNTDEGNLLNPPET